MWQLFRIIFPFDFFLSLPQSIAFSLSRVLCHSRSKRSLHVVLFRAALLHSISRSPPQSCALSRSSLFALAINLSRILSRSGCSSSTPLSLCLGLYASGSISRSLLSCCEFHRRSLSRTLSVVFTVPLFPSHFVGTLYHNTYSMSPNSEHARRLAKVDHVCGSGSALRRK